MNQRERWTQTQISDLRAGIQRGESVEAVAAALDRSPDEVLAMMDRLRLSKQVFAAS
jgi:hypothetical protein